MTVPTSSEIVYALSGRNAIALGADRILKIEIFAASLWLAALAFMPGFVTQDNAGSLAGPDPNPGATPVEMIDSAQRAQDRAEAMNAVMSLTHPQTKQP